MACIFLDKFRMQAEALYEVATKTQKKLPYKILFQSIETVKMFHRGSLVLTFTEECGNQKAEGYGGHDKTQEKDKDVKVKKFLFSKGCQQFINLNLSTNGR